MLPTNGPAHAVVTSSRRRPASDGRATSAGVPAMTGSPSDSPVTRTRWSATGSPAVRNGRTGATTSPSGVVESAEEAALGEVRIGERVARRHHLADGPRRVQGEVEDLALVRSAYQPRISSQTSSTRPARAARVR